MSAPTEPPRRPLPRESPPRPARRPRPGPHRTATDPARLRIGQNKWFRSIVQVLVPLLIVAVVAVVLRTYVVSPYYIPSASMEPTLHGCSGCDNDRVLVDKFTYRLRDPTFGDVVVFHKPKAWSVSEDVLIKRVIGLPGDTLTLRDGTLFRNGKQVSEPYVNDKCPPMTSLGNTDPAKVGPIPDGQMFVMGDNRCDSSDSRVNGLVAEDDVIGRAFIIIWPLGRLHWL